MSHSDWFEEEKNAYESMRQGLRGEYTMHTFDEYYWKLDKSAFSKKITVLGYGAADGKELERIAQYCDRICIVDPTMTMKNDELEGVKLEYFSPNKEGKLCFEDETFDMITCKSVLMYIMNPESVILELLRVLKRNGVLHIC